VTKVEFRAAEWGDTAFDPKLSQKWAGFRGEY